MSAERKPIATSNQLATAIMGRIGKGPADRANLIGAIVDRGYDYTAADNALNEHLEGMVRAGLIERVELPSTYALGQRYPVWRLPASVPMERTDAEPGRDAVPVGHISASAFKASGKRGRK